MAKGKHTHSGRSGGKKGRGTNNQTRRNHLVSESDDAFTRPDRVGVHALGTLSGDEGGMDEEGEEQCSPRSSSASSFLFKASPLISLATDVTITVPVAMWVSSPQLSDR